MEGEPRLHRGPHAGDRLPDARLRRGGQPTWLQQELAAPFMHLLLCGPVAAWNSSEIVQLRRRYHDLLAVTHLSREVSPLIDEALIDDGGGALSRLGVDDTAQYLVRPDGHVAFRCGGADLRGVAAYLREWFH